MILTSNVTSDFNSSYFQEDDIENVVMIQSFSQNVKMSHFVLFVKLNNVIHRRMDLRGSVTETLIPFIVHAHFVGSPYIITHIPFYL